MAENYTTELDAEIEVRDVSKREIGVRIVPWDTVIDTAQGAEEFKRGAFEGTDPAKVVLRMDHQNPPAGIGLSLEEREDAAYMVFRVSKTQRGDEILTLAADGVAKGASVGFMERAGGTTIETRSGRRVRVHRKTDLREVSTTWMPAYPQAEVQYVRAEAEEAPVAENEMVPAAGTPAVDLTPLQAQIAAMSDNFSERFEKIEERNRADLVIPAGTVAERTMPDRGIWMQAALRMLSGERIANMQMRDLEDIVTTDNIGVVPPTYSSELIGVISRRRPFMESTRRLATPTTGMSLIVPRIVTRPTVAEQLTEKYELDSTATAIDTVTFDAVTKGGAGDISLQLLKRSSPSFLTLYLDLLAEALAIEAEKEAVAALLAAGSGSDVVNDGGDFDPEDANLGDAWIAGYNATYGAPDTIWMSSAAVGAFIDAKATDSNLPLYSTLAANFTAGGGVGGSISGLRPVHVPALNSTAYDIIVGPSNGFAWAEDGAYTLQVDVPAKAGRDVALVSIYWWAPLYPSAFTAWALAGS